jgi:Icc-related predicted phosphoesterase
MRGAPMTRIIYTSDLHGDLDLYRAAGEAAHARGADVLIFGGDLCPGTPSPRHTELPQSQPAFLLEEVAPLVEAWKTERPALRVFAIPGNDDCGTTLAALADLDQRGLLINLHQKLVTTDDVEFIGLAFVPPTPFSFKDFERRDTAAWRPREPQLGRAVLATPDGFQDIASFDSYLRSHPTIEDELARLKPPNPRRTIAVMHSPPYGTKCDVLFNGRHIGSAAIRRWIERHQPLLSLHGHIHESPRESGSFHDRIGETIVVNPGASGRQPHWVWIDLNDLTAIEHAVYGRPL